MKILLLLAFAASAFGQTTFTNGLGLPITTVAALPTASSNAGRVFEVSDGTTINDCTTGSGSAKALCWSNGTAWAAIGSGNARACNLLAGASNGASLVALDIAPQVKQCQIPVAATIFEIAVDADAGTSSVQVQKRHCSTIASGACTAWTNTNLLSGELPTLTGGFPACARTATAQTCVTGGGITSSGSITVATGSSANVLAAGDWIETSTSTLTGAPKLYNITIYYTVN